MFNVNEVVRKSPFVKIDHIGLIVRDFDKAVEYYQSLGMGPLKSTSPTTKEKRVRGKPADDVKNKVGLAQLGGVWVEIIQPLEGESVHTEFLKSKGEGINHVAYRVADLDKEVSNLVQRGFKVVYSGKFINGGGWAYFDMSEIGGIFLEIVQWPPAS